MSEVRYVFRAPGVDRRVMHIAQFTITGEMLWKSLCGRTGFNRSINAPWGLGRPRCKQCMRVLRESETSE